MVSPMLFLNHARFVTFFLSFIVSTATLVYCDNVSVVYLSENPVHHQRAKHIEMDIDFVCEKVK